MLHELWGLGEQRNRAFRMIMRVICLVLAFFKKRESSSQQVDFLIVENKGERLVKTSPNIKDTLHLWYVFTHARVSLIGKMIVRAKWFAVVTCMILHRTRAWSAPSFTGLRSARQACLHAFTVMRAIQAFDNAFFAPATIRIYACSSCQDALGRGSLLGRKVEDGIPAFWAPSVHRTVAEVLFLPPPRLE